MADADFVIKSGATFPPIAATLTDADGVALPLAGPGVAAVHFRMKPMTGGGAVVDHVAVIVNPTTGQVRYDWQAGDTAVPGYYWAEWAIVYSTGATQPVPSDDYLRVLVTAGLG